MVAPVAHRLSAQQQGKHREPLVQPLGDDLWVGRLAEPAELVVDRRAEPDDPQSKVYQQYGGGNEYTTNDSWLAQTSYNSGRPYLGEVNYGGSLGTTGHYADLGRKEVRMWWGTQYEHLYEQGLEMVWQDMTTPCVRDTRGDMKGFPFRLLVTDDSVSGADPTTSEAIRVWNLYSYNLHKATYHGLNNLPGRQNKRNFIVGRGSFTGMHRFAALWTGDNASTWDFLRINVAQVLSLGMSAQALCGQDIGGFAQGEPGQRWVGPELHMRWTMAGAFLPWFRNHYVRKGQKEFQEPFQYTEWFATYNQPVPDPALYEMVVPVCRHYIGLRYRLMQLFYDAMFESTPHNGRLRRGPGRRARAGAGQRLVLRRGAEPQRGQGGRRQSVHHARADVHVGAAGARRPRCLSRQSSPQAEASAGRRVP
jgi:alpha-glucosidase